MIKEKLFKIPVGEEEKDEYINYLEKLKHEDIKNNLTSEELSELIFLIKDINIIYKLVNILKEETEISVRHKIPMNIIKLLVDSNMKVYLGSVQLDQLYSLELLCYIVYREKYDLLYHICERGEVKIVCLAEEIIEIINKHKLDDKQINIYISFILILYEVELDVFNKLIEFRFNIEFNYNIKGFYPLLSQQNVETVERMMELGYKYYNDVRFWEIKISMKLYMLHLKHCLKLKIYVEDYIHSVKSENKEEFEELMRFYKSNNMRYIITKKSVLYNYTSYKCCYDAVIVYTFKDNEYEVSYSKEFVDNLNIMLDYGFLPRKDEMKDILFSLNDKYVKDKTLIDRIKNLSFEDETEEEFHEIKEKLFNENISVRRFRKLTKKLPYINCEYKGQSLMMFHYKNPKIFKMIVGKRGMIDEYKEVPLEKEDLSLDLFKKYMRSICIHHNYQNVVDVNIHNFEKVKAMCDFKEGAHYICCIMNHEKLDERMLKHIFDNCRGNIEEYRGIYEQLAYSCRNRYSLFEILMLREDIVLDFDVEFDIDEKHTLRTLLEDKDKWEDERVYNKLISLMN